MPTTADFHVPRSMVGMTIFSVPVKEHFRLVRLDIEKYVNNNFHLSRLLKIVDRVDDTNCLGHMRSMLVLNHMTTYLRIKLLSNDARIVEKVAVLIDTLVKNCHYRVHLLIGNRIFMKTFGIVTRQHLIDERPTYCRVGQRMLDILQGWGESFSQAGRCIIYPHIVDTYQKMQFKYGISYPRAHHDPLRVPILFGPLHKYEVFEAQGKRSDIKNDMNMVNCHGVKVFSSCGAKLGLIREMRNKTLSISTDMLAPTSPRLRNYICPHTDASQAISMLSSICNDQSQDLKDVKSDSILRSHGEERTSFERELADAAIKVKLSSTQKIIHCEEIDQIKIRISPYDATKASIRGQIVCRQDLLSASECSTSASSIEEMIHGNLDGFNTLENDCSKDFATSASGDLISNLSAGDSYTDCAFVNADDNRTDDLNIIHCAANNIETIYSCNPPISLPHQGNSTYRLVDKISYHSAMSPNYERKYMPNCISNPSSDPDLEVKYFGHQRVLVRKARK
jgi:hypothetical protein